MTDHQGFGVGPGVAMAQGEIGLTVWTDIPAPVIPATIATAGSTPELFAPSASFDGTVQYAVISTPPDQASAFQRLAKTVVILGPKNITPT